MWLGVLVATSCSQYKNSSRIYRAAAAAAAAYGCSAVLKEEEFWLSILSGRAVFSVNDVHKLPQQACGSRTSQVSHSRTLAGGPALTHILSKPGKTLGHLSAAILRTPASSTYANSHQGTPLNRLSVVFLGLQYWCRSSWVVGNTNNSV